MIFLASRSWQKPDPFSLGFRRFFGKKDPWKERGRFSVFLGCHFEWRIVCPDPNVSVLLNFLQTKKGHKTLASERQNVELGLRVLKIPLVTYYNVLPGCSNITWSFIPLTCSKKVG